MSNFSRGISDQFIAALKKEYDNGGWWRKIVDDKDLFIAIRNEYINVYLKGNSLVKLSFPNGEIVAETHYKYLIKPKITPCLMKTSTSSSMDFIPNNAEKYFIHNLSDMDSIKTASAAYSSIEKEGVQKIIKSNDNIVDLEIALTKEAEEDEMIPEMNRKNTAQRIDFAALQKKDNYFELIFFEAKDFSNPELRAQGADTLPRVIDQIEKYQELLITYKTDIINSYKKVCRNLYDILPHDRLGQAVKEIAEKGTPVEVSVEPRLVLFGFDDDQKTGSCWEDHKNKLIANLKKNFLAKGNPAGFKNGIAQAKR